MTQQMLVFMGFSGRISAGCQVFLIFRDCRLARIEYSRGLSNSTRSVRTLDLLPDFVVNSDWRTRCVARWWIDDDELDLIDFNNISIDRSVVESAFLVNGRLASITKISA